MIYKYLGLKVIPLQKLFNFSPKDESVVGFLNTDHLLINEITEDKTLWDLYLENCEINR